MRFAVWLRTQYEFPIRLPVYLSPLERITTLHGDEVSASIFIPDDAVVDSPHVRIATGDYAALHAKWGRDGTLESYLHSLAHEVVHYRQWLETGDFWERGTVRAASAIVDRYAETVDHP